MQFKAILLLSIFMLSLPASMRPYPIDGYATTGIRRLAYLRDVVNGDVRGRMPLPGAMK